MPWPARTTAAVSRPQGVLAWLLAGMVLALGLLTVSPSTHALLHAGAGNDHAHHGHGHSHGVSGAHDDLGCAVTLFQLGVTTPLDLPRIDSPRATWVIVLRPTRAALPLSSPAYLHQPVRGPPGIG